ncbi:hypothetical protein LSAT2_022130 [Lamellibrachia satsuma]|nr:hypothetical protein LSAT2_022130 [Lamellibrachia satsuma]
MVLWMTRTCRASRRLRPSDDRRTAVERHLTNEAKTATPDVADNRAPVATNRVLSERLRSPVTDTATRIADSHRTTRGDTTIARDLTSASRRRWCSRQVERLTNTDSSFCVCSCGPSQCPRTFYGKMDIVLNGLALTKGVWAVGTP